MPLVVVCKHYAVYVLYNTYIFVLHNSDWTVSTLTDIKLIYDSNDQGSYGFPYIRHQLPCILRSPCSAGG